MRELHHIGIPTDKKQENEGYLEGGKVFFTDPEKSPNKIEWLRFEADSPMPELLRTVTHIAYKVPDLAEAIKGKEILIEPFDPFEGRTIAFVIEEGAPIELLQDKA
ncbi:MAG: VOC family protein [Planctomycetota bacterium]|jgi:hypothetical protein